jgi:dihydrolipoamide dehydrogenase
MKTYDLAVIGGGPAGYHSAEYAAKKGLSVALFEKARLGGTCLNAGCIPTKSLLDSAKHFSFAEDGPADAREQAHAAAVSKKDGVVDRLVKGVAGGLKSAAVDVFCTTASIEKTSGGFRVYGESGEATAKNVLLASGSVPSVPPIPGVKEGIEEGYVVTSGALLEKTTLPKRLVIVGGGVIGMEMGAYFLSAGVSVTVVEMLDKILGPSDREVSGLLQREMERRGMQIRLNARVTSVGRGRLVYEQDGQTKEEPFDTLLLSVGRRPNLSIGGLSELGVATERGALVTDERCRTNVPNVFAAGDINGKQMLAHVANREGEVAVNTILGLRDEMDYSAICAVAYTKPEAAFVGLNEEQAKAAGLDISVRKVSINFSGRHVAENGLSKGVCKILVDQKRGIIVGAAVLSAYASEYIYTLALMIQNKIPVESILKTVFPHPTVCEIIRDALQSGIQPVRHQN